MTMISKRSRVIGALSVLLVAALLAPAVASAGTVTLSGTCGLWRTYGYTNTYIAAYPACPELVTRNVGGSFRSPVTVEGGWVFDAPPGTSVASFALEASLLGLSGWQVAVIPTSGVPVENCPGAHCPGANKHLSIQNWYSGFNSPAIILRLRCGSSNGCPNNTLYTYLGVTNAAVTLNDAAPPAIAITGGQLVLPGWKRATQPVSYSASDNLGIRAVRAYLDGQARAEELRTCNYAALTPCPNGGGTLALGTTGVADGPHRLTVQAIDAAGNASQVVRTVYIDNTPPASPGSVALVGGAGWTSVNRFGMRWSNPPQSASPIVAADYRICPAGEPRGSARCTAGSASGANITSIQGVKVPGEGAWTIAVALRDAAGNVSPGSAATVTGLRYDATPPVASLAPISPNDPTRVRVNARDATSGIAARTVEIQRAGTGVWTELPTTPFDGGFSAQLDDGELADGTYLIRAHVTDAAGNVRTVSTLPDGTAAALALPVRIKTRLAVGRVTRVLARQSRSGKKRYRRILVTRPRARYGRTVRVSGRLTTPGANPVTDAPVEVWEQIDLPGAPWTRIAEVRTSRTGRFTFKALRGPSRLLRFRYAGTATVRSRTSIVDLRVKAGSSLRASRTNAVNGQSVTFSGRLTGRPLPAGGKLVELQVFTRGQWRTFAQARADAATGRWSYRYRFEAVVGRAAFRFRARIRREATYPFELGTSRRVLVNVRGA